MSDPVIITNREIYDSLLAVQRDVAAIKFELAEARFKRAGRWQLWLAMIGPFIALPIGVIALVKG